MNKDVLLNELYIKDELAMCDRYKASTSNLFRYICDLLSDSYTIIVYDPFLPDLPENKKRFDSCESFFKAYPQCLKYHSQP